MIVRLCLAIFTEVRMTAELTGEYQFLKRTVIVLHQEPHTVVVKGMLDERVNLCTKITYLELVLQ